LFIHDTNFTRQVLAAMTIIIKFLPHDIAAGDRVAIASEVAKEGARVLLDGAIEKIKSQDSKTMLPLLSTRLIVQTKCVHSSDCSRANFELLPSLQTK
jgi:hypothetical protein